MIKTTLFKAVDAADIIHINHYEEEQIWKGSNSEVIYIDTTSEERHEFKDQLIEIEPFDGQTFAKDVKGNKHLLTLKVQRPLNEADLEP